MGAVSVLLVGEFFAGFKFKTSGISMQKNILGLFVVLLGIGIGLAFYLSSNDVFHDEIAWRFTMDYLSQAAATRVSHWHQNLALFQTSPVFGVGSLAHAGDFKYAADNEWLLLLRTGGVVLVLLVIRLFFTRLVRQGVRGEGKRLSLAFALGACIYMIPAAFFFSLVLMPLLLMFWAIAAPAPWKILRKKPRVSVSQVRLMSIEGQPSNGG